MIRVAIIEDDAAIADYVSETIRQLDNDVSVVAELQTVRDSVAFFTGGKEVDLIFCDVQLSDGHSFEIFKSVEVKAPVVFVTGYDSFLLQAFETNGIEYLMKPVYEEDLTRALNKYKSLAQHFAGEAKQALRAVSDLVEKNHKRRLLVKKGIEHVPLLLADIVFFYTENKVVLAVDNTGKKFIVDRNLNELENELGESRFFRANRQYLLNIDYVKSFKPYERVKLWVELTTSSIDYTIVVSQFTSPSFRTWLQNA